MLFQLVRESLEAMDSIHPVTARARQQFSLVAFLTAMIRAIDASQGAVAHAYARVLLTRHPKMLVRSRLYQRLLMMCLSGGLTPRFLLMLVKLAQMTYAKWVRLRPTRYQTIG